MGENSLELALLEISIYPTEKDSENGLDTARVVKLVRPLLDRFCGILYLQQPGVLRAAFLEISQATACLTELHQFIDSDNWPETGLHLSLKLSFELPSNPAQFPENSKLLAEMSEFQTEEGYDWLFGKLFSHLKTEKPKFPSDQHWYDFLNGSYRPALDWLQKQLLVDQYSSKNFILCTMALLNLRMGEVGEVQRLSINALNSLQKLGICRVNTWLLLSWQKLLTSPTLKKRLISKQKPEPSGKESWQAASKAPFLPGLAKRPACKPNLRPLFASLKKPLK